MNVAKELTRKHKAILHFLRLKGEQGATQLELNRFLDANGIFTARIASDISEVRKITGLDIQNRHEGTSANGAKITRWMIAPPKPHTTATQERLPL